MSRHAIDHIEWDDTSAQDSAQALDGDDNLLALGQRAERAASLAFLATAAAALICALATI